MYKIADVIYEPFGIDILAHLDKFLDHKDTYLKREARQAYKEWKGMESRRGFKGIWKVFGDAQGDFGLRVIVEIFMDFDFRA